MNPELLTHTLATQHKEGVGVVHSKVESKLKRFAEGDGQRQQRERIARDSNERSAAQVNLSHAQLRYRQQRQEKNLKDIQEG